MEKRILVFCIFFVLPNFVKAQRELSFKDETPENAMVTGEKGEAGVIITCPDNLSLTFDSSMDEQVNIYKQEESNGFRKYYMRFPTGEKYEGRNISVFCQGFKTFSISVKLTPNIRKDFYVYDPNASIGVSCFEQFRNEGHELFKKSAYQEAKEKYLLAKQCTDCREPEAIDERLRNIDSILVYKQEAERHFAFFRYNEAIEYYNKIQLLNPDDEFNKSRIVECRIKLKDLCDEYLANADRLYDNGDYREANKLYEKLKDQGCGDINHAIVRMADIETKLVNKKQRAHVLTYEYTKNTPFGISTGNYKDNKFSGYFALKFNSDLFQLMRSDTAKAKAPEINVSFGWTRRVYNPVWIFFGPGYTFKSEYVATTDNENIDDNITTSKSHDYKLKTYHAISPEVGLLGKIGPAVIRYTFQYRFALSKDYDDKIKKVKHTIGLGICF